VAVAVAVAVAVGCGGVVVAVFWSIQSVDLSR